MSVALKDDDTFFRHFLSFRFDDAAFRWRFYAFNIALRHCY